MGTRLSFIAAVSMSFSGVHGSATRPIFLGISKPTSLPLTALWHKVVTSATTLGWLQSPATSVDAMPSSLAKLSKPACTGQTSATQYDSLERA
eukprot:648927-Pleurochrysis_carterae.AAC.1